MADWGYALSQGIASGAQVGGGLIDASLKEDADKRASDRRLDDQQRLLAAQEAMQERVAENAYQRQQRPNEAAGALLRDAAGTQVPASPEYGDTPKVTLSGTPEEVDAKINAIRNNPEQTDDSRALVAAYDARKAAESDAQGKTRPANREEAIQAALNNAIQKGDAVSYERLKAIAGDQYTPIPEGGLLNRTTGEVISTGMSKYDREKALQDSKFDQQSSLLDKKLSAAAGKNGVPDSITDQEKTNWVTAYVQGGGAVSRNAPAYVKNNVAAWAVDQGITADDIKNGKASAKTEMDFASGKQGNAVRSFNVALSHLDTLSGLATALNNGDVQGINKLGNYLATQTGGAAPTNFNAVKHIVADEIVKAVVGSAGALGDREAAAKVIDSANSPEQLFGVIQQYKELMKGQLVGLRDQYQNITGRSDFEQRFLSSAARDVAHGGEGTAPNPFNNANTAPSVGAQIPAGWAVKVRH